MKNIQYPCLFLFNTIRFFNVVLSLIQKFFQNIINKIKIILFMIL